METTPKLAYKGFDRNLQCRDSKFEIGTIYSKTEGSNNPVICTAQGFHYCNKLTHVFSYYGKEANNRFCQIEVLGKFTDNSDKSITTSFRIVKELSKEEVNTICEEEKALLEKDKLEKKKLQLLSNLKLDVAKEVQENYPLTHVGGSTGLFLHGIRLKRWESSAIGDLDIVSPYFILFESNKDKNIAISYEDAKASGNDFDETFIWNRTKVDVKIDPKQRYEIIEFQGFRYKVSLLETIVDAKLKYALKGQKKHKDDLYEIMGKTSNVKAKNQTTNDFWDELF